MPWIQSFRVISIFSALLIALWLPIRILDFNLPIELDIIFDLFVMVVSAINIYLHFYENKVSFRDWKNWLRVGVLLDVLCFMPFSLFQAENDHTLLINIIATRHIFRIKSFLDQFDSLQPVVYRLVPLALTMPILVHLIACAWIAMGSGTAGPDPDKITEYVKAIYWAFTTLTTVGYGDISAKTNPQMLFTCVIQVVGVGVFGFVISNVASLLSRMDAAREHHMDSLDKVETFMKTHGIPQNLKSKVRSYYHYLWTHHKGYTDRTLMDSLPEKMQSELYLFINQSIVKKVPLLNGASEELLEELMTQLQPQIFIPGQKIFRVNEHGDAMYFIHNGRVNILGSDQKLIVSLGDGAFFGEMALVTDSARSATAVSETYCDVYRLSREAFKQVVESHPEFHAHIKSIVEKRQAA